VTVLVRADSSDFIGFGHLSRCLTLADGLRSRGVDVMFATATLQGSRIEAIEDAGFECVTLDESDRLNPHACVSRVNATGHRPDWVVVDGYDFDSSWDIAFAVSGIRVAVIDDLAERERQCELLLDVSCDAQKASRYDSLVPRTCEVFYGPRHALLRREFTAEPPRIREAVAEILITFGGADPGFQTLAACEAIEQLACGTGWHASALFSGNDSRARFLSARFAASERVHIEGFSADVAEKMRRADVGLGAGGTSTWERCRTGLPSLLVVAAPNQRDTVRLAEEAGIALAVAEAPTDAATWQRALSRLCVEPELVARMSRSAVALAEHMRPARRHALVEALIARGVERRFALRPIEVADERRLLEWRGNPDVRRWMRDSAPLGPERHAEWMRRMLAHERPTAFVFERGGEPAGFVQFSPTKGDVSEREWGFYVAPEAQGEGLSWPLGLMALDLIFDEGGASRVLGDVAAENAASLRVHDSLGFERRPSGALDRVSFTLMAQRWEAVRTGVARKAFARG
jgi:UDP-2,4-diacetamido-2,4,6-trideoxy-beta-L-altropyranose hydrolase